MAAYKDFEDRFEIIEEKLLEIEMVRKATQQRIGKFNKQKAGYFRIKDMIFPVEDDSED